MAVQDIGSNIAKIRKQKGYSQAKLAEVLNVSPQAVSKWETGINFPDVELLLEMSKLFHVSVDGILLNENYTDTEDFMRQNMAAPKKKQIEGIPRISRWEAPEGCDMFYSMAAMIAEALCAADHNDAADSEPLSLSVVQERFHEVMHVTGIAYGFMWRTERRNLVEELWRMSDLSEIVDCAMRYAGRNYHWLTCDNSTREDMRKMLVWSIDHGHPVVMEWAGGIPEYSIITGYDENGNTITGYTYCEECASSRDPDGKFRVPTRWDEDTEDFRMLIIGDKTDPTFTDRDSIIHALRVLDAESAADKSEIMQGTLAGETALQAWLDACDTPENALNNMLVSDMYTYGLEMNSIYTQKAVMPYFRKLGEKSPKSVDNTVIQIGIAVNNLTSDRSAVINRLNVLRNDISEKGDEIVRLCRGHIESIIRYRTWLRGWFGELIEKL
ncbi:MAG: helix-turn-helix transcriptional regulator [Clostridia bacterium]|nr:helix-turn-helix transcriptional regulator [Clostridia bacterium]